MLLESASAGHPQSAPPPPEPEAAVDAVDAVDSARVRHLASLPVVYGTWFRSETTPRHKKNASISLVPMRDLIVLKTG